LATADADAQLTMIADDLRATLARHRRQDGRHVAVGDASKAPGVRPGVRRPMQGPDGPPIVTGDASAMPSILALS
jgi:hypothetical protein